MTLARPVPRIATVLIGIAGLLAAAPPASAAQRVITSAGPLTSIYVNDDLGCSVERNGLSQVFGGTDPGSCGTFLAWGDDVYGPAGVSDSATMTLTPVSQGTVTGTGTLADPFQVETVVTAGELQITQTESYVVGDDFYKTDIEVVKNTVGSVAAKLYHAADCYVRGDDEGYGHNPGTGAIYCSRAPDLLSSGALGFEPITAGSNLIEDLFSNVFSAVNGAALPDTCECASLLDNGAGISWSFTASAVPQTFSFRTKVTADTLDPDTSIASGPGPAPTSDNTPTFSFTTNEPSATFTCSVDGADPPVVPCNGGFSHTSAPLANGPHVFRVMATDPDGNQDPTPATRSFTVLAPPAGGGGGGPGGGGGSGGVLGVTAQSKPVVAKTANLGLVSGTVRVRRKGSKRFVPLTGDAQIPVGSTVDARTGRVRVTVGIEGGKTNTAEFFDGIFKLLQKKAKRPVAEMRLAGKLENCKTAKGSAEARQAARKRRGRRLWGKGKGRFRTRGKRSSALVRGTTWLVEDRCDGSTLTRVAAGLVEVRDFAARKTVDLKQGRRYVARAKKRGR